MYKYYGKHRDSGPAKNRRSRREDAEVFSPKATAGRSSSTHYQLILSNNDDSKSSFVTMDLEVWIKKNLNYEFYKS